MAHTDRARFFITLRTFIMREVRITHTTTGLTGTTITHIEAMRRLRTLPPLLGLTMVEQMGRGTPEVMPITIGAGTMAHNMQAGRTLMPRQANILLRLIRLHFTLEGLEGPEGPEVLQETLERAVLEETLELLARQVWLDQEALQHPHDHKVAQENVEVQEVEEVSL